MIQQNISLSPDFKRQTTKAILSIVLFIVVYLIMIALAIALTALCIYGGIMLIAIFPRFITIMLGLGLASLGVLILIFLVKFIAKSHKVDRSSLTEIKRQDEPELFRMIDELVAQVGTTSPRKVYLSHEVNAAVFYNSSFWSMFLPIRKNLLIGVGLVNTVTRDELKAILAHEFGHFSQRTMKVGSYVYNVNQVIYNMMFENDSYEKLVQTWSSISDYITIFVMLAVKIIQGIQFVLRKMYTLVNLSYMALSREMEFHADEVAAHVTGYPPLKRSLLRLDLAQESLQQVLSFYGDRVSENVRSANLFADQRVALNLLANDAALPFEHGLPLVTTEQQNRFNKSKLVVKDQWASHPSVEERVSRLEQTRIVLPHEDTTPANTLFRNFEETQRRVTEKTFAGVTYTGTVSLQAADAFQVRYEARLNQFSFNKIYQGYYDRKNPKWYPAPTTPVTTTADALFAPDKVDRVLQILGMKQDLDMLKQIETEARHIETFDYDGRKYTRADIPDLQNQLTTACEQLESNVEAHDQTINAFFQQQATAHGRLDMLRHDYEKLEQTETETNACLGLHYALMSTMSFVHENATYDVINIKLSQLAPLEVRLREDLHKMMQDKELLLQVSADARSNFEKFLSQSRWVYFTGQEYLTDNLNMLLGAIHGYREMAMLAYFNQKKKLLDFQVTLLN